MTGTVSTSASACSSPSGPSSREENGALHVSYAAEPPLPEPVTPPKELFLTESWRVNGMNEFKPFDDRLNGLIAALSPSARRKLAGEIAKEMRKSQQQRIKQQKAPDGSPYQARKRQPLRKKNGRIKRAMFQKIRTSRYMKATGRENSAVVEFADTVQCIASVHQDGLKDRSNLHAHNVQYPRRILIGFSEREKIVIMKLITNALSSRSA